MNQAENTTTQILFRISHWFMLLACLALLFVAINRPIQNWDMLGYAGAISSFETSDKEVIHKSVYEQFKSYATEDELQELLHSTDYRKTMYQDSDAFNQQIPFYKIRLLFLALILLVTKVVSNVFLASHIVAAVAGLGGLIAFYYAFRKLIHPALWLVVPMFFMVFSGLDIARMVTADSLAFLWVGMICYSYIHDKRSFLYFLLLTSVLVRTDLIVLVAIFVVFFVLFKPSLRVQSVFVLVATLITYFLINHFTDNYGWSTVFYYALVSNMQATHPEVYSTLGITFSQYFSEFFSNLGGFVYEVPLLLFLALVLLQFIVFFMSQKKSDTVSSLFQKIVTNIPLVLTIISIGYVIGHYILFPLLVNRFFLAEYMIALLSFFVLLSKIIISEKQS